MHAHRERVSLSSALPVVLRPCGRLDSSLIEDSFVRQLHPRVPEGLAHAAEPVFPHGHDLCCLCRGRHSHQLPNGLSSGKKGMGTLKYRATLEEQGSVTTTKKLRCMRSTPGSSVLCASFVGLGMGDVEKHRNGQASSEITEDGATKRRVGITVGRGLVPAGQLCLGPGGSLGWERALDGSREDTRQGPVF